MKMAKRGGTNDVARKAWNILRLALLWARKGGAFKRRLMIGVTSKFLKSLGHHTSRSQLQYGERELSFDKTPIFHFKMHRPASIRFIIPCLTPQVDFDYDFHDHFTDHEHHDDHFRHQDGAYNECFCDGERRSFLLKCGDPDEEHEYEYESTYGEIPIEEKEEEEEEEEEEGIDLRAEAFIAKIHKQMRLQRQISYLQYHETPRKSTS